MVGSSSAWGAVVYVAALVITTSDAENARKKDREVSGLYPFPRVGRQTSRGSESAFNEYIKRQGLIPFPRVGRGGGGLFRSERQEGVANDVKGLWFGPRLGRSLKGDRDSNSEWALIQVENPASKAVMPQESDGLEPSTLMDNVAESSDNSNIRILPI